MTEFEKWVAEQPKSPITGKVDGRLLLNESHKRGYCVCPKPMRQMISFEDLTCADCMQQETRQSWEFYYKDVDS